jgi:site-specific DNA-methyltransferase (adenine-specific)
LAASPWQIIKYMENLFLNMDCMEGMKQYPDGYFDLGLIDPNYGIEVNHNMGRRKGQKRSEYKPAYWDKEPVSKKILDEIFRVTKNQIIWGANHFISKMPYDSPCWLMWDKGLSEDLTFAQYELAWTSFNGTCKKYDKRSNVPDRIHPTQKPVCLYKWQLKNYAHPGDKILDTHVGSASSLIACEEMGFNYVGYELDKDYYDAACKRLNNYRSQIKLFPALPLSLQKERGRGEVVTKAERL